MNTLEAFVAALLIVGALLFASQATAVTPLSASTSNQHIENQQEVMANDFLALVAEDGVLKDSVLYWDGNNSAADPASFRDTDPDRLMYTSFGDMGGNPLQAYLNASFADADNESVYAMNIDLLAIHADGSRDSVRLLEMGTPSDNAVSASRVITLFEEDLITEDGEDLALADAEEDQFWTDNDPESDTVYAVVEVRLTIWRM